MTESQQEATCGRCCLQPAVHEPSSGPPRASLATGEAARVIRWTLLGTLGQGDKIYISFLFHGMRTESVDRTHVPASSHHIHPSSLGACTVAWKWDAACHSHPSCRFPANSVALGIFSFKFRQVSMLSLHSHCFPSRSMLVKAGGEVGSINWDWAALGSPAWFCLWEHTTTALSAKSHQLPQNDLFVCP